MRKHLLGLAIFSFIVVSFAIAFAYFYVPKTVKIKQVQIPHIERIDKPYCAMEMPSKCERKFGNIKFEVVSTIFDLDEMKLISKIKMNLGDFGKLPTTVMVVANLYQAENAEGKNKITSGE